MANATVSGVYATALLDLAQERGVAPAVVAAASVVAAGFSREIVQALEQPGLGRANARTAMQSALAEAPVEILNLALLLLDRGRLSDLADVLAATVALFEQRNGVRHVTVTTAAPLSAQGEQRVIQALHTAIGTGARVSNHVDASIIGGMTLRYDDVLVDGSVRRSLNEMKATMLTVPVGAGLWTNA